MSRTILITSEPVARFSAPPADRMAGRPSRTAKAARQQGNYAPGSAGAKAAAEARANSFLDRETLLDQAVLEGVISGSVRAHYAQCYDKDPEGTRSYLQSIGLRGGTPATSAASEGYMENHLSQAERSRITAARERRPPSRIVNGGL